MGAPHGQQVEQGTMRLTGPDGEEGQCSGPIDSLGRASGQGELLYDERCCYEEDMCRFVGDFSEGRMIRGVVFCDRHASETMDNGAWTDDLRDDIADASPKRAVPGPEVHRDGDDD